MMKAKDIKARGGKYDWQKRRYVFPSKNPVEKYPSMPREYAGHQFDSRLEARYATFLDWEVVGGRIKGYQKQKTYWLYGRGGKKICEHKVDFLVEMLDGSLEAHETKGFQTKEWYLKRKLFEDNYPEIPYKVIRYQDLPYVSPLGKK